MQLRHWIAVITIARGEAAIDQSSVLIDHQVQFKAKEPIDPGFASGCQSLEHPVTGNAAIVVTLTLVASRKLKPVQRPKLYLR
jgi:hypothetical protein